jgi:eukaryotic-like serine/threonine-protein kinase
MDELNRKSTLSSVAAYRFGLFSLDVSTGFLTRNGVRIKLQDQPLQLLVLLLEKGGEIVTREEIRQRLWQSNTFVDFDKSLGVAVVKVRDALGDSASNPRFLETIPRRGYRFIAPVSLETPSVHSNPAPPVSLPDVPAASPRLSTEPATSSPPPLPTPKEQRGKANRKTLWYVTAALGVMFAIAFAAFRFHSVSRPKAESPPAVQTRLRRSVAVLGFRNVAAGPDQNWLSTAFTEMLNTELAANGDLRLVSGEDVANVKHDLSLPAEDTLAKSTLTRLRLSLGADVVVVGSYTLLSDGGKNRIRLDMRAQDTGLGETIFENSITGDEKDLFDLASQAGSRLREGLDPSLSLAPAESSKLEGSTNQLALQFYSEGLARLYEFDFIGARDLFKRAIGADPEFAEAHSALSSAFDSLGYEAQAREEARRALQHARDLPQETALSIQGQYQESISEWPKAALTYQKLFQLFPDNLTYGLQLARAQLHVSPADSAHTLALLRMLPAPVGDDPRIDLMEASVLIGQDLPKSRAAAQRAIAKASAHGATLTVARGYGILCQQDFSIGQSMDQSISECNLARNGYISAGDQNNAARTLNDLAGLFFQHGDLVKAQTMWQEAIEVFRKVGDTQGLAASANNVGDVLLTRGKLNDARKLLEQAMAGYRLIGDRAGVALAMVDLGQIDLQKGDLPAARSNYEQAIAIATQIADKSATAYGVAGLGDVFTLQDQLTEARKQYELALKLRKEIGEKQAILQTRVALVRLAIEDGHARDAEPEARQCLNELHHEQLPDDEIGAGIVLADALLNLSKNADAKKELDALRALEEKTLNRELQLRFSLEFARVLFAEHDPDSSRTLLDQVLKDADACGFASLAWEAQTVLAKVQGDGGDVVLATKQLKLLKTRERSAGFLLLARKADATTRSWANTGK